MLVNLISMKATDSPVGKIKNRIALAQRVCVVLQTDGEGMYGVISKVHKDSITNNYANVCTFRVLHSVEDKAVEIHKIGRESFSLLSLEKLSRNFSDNSAQSTLTELFEKLNVEIVDCKKKLINTHSQESLHTIIVEACPAHTDPEAAGITSLEGKQSVPPRQSHATALRGVTNLLNLHIQK
jgi:Glu-tRNA(Gln) amidotransferase subunit E-like FAD-binding protein